MNDKKDMAIQDKIIEHTEKKINDILTQGIQAGNVDMLYKLVDIHKDVYNEDYWEMMKEENEMRYSRGYGEGGNYGRGSYNEGRSYGARGRSRDSRGRYKESGRGGRYRGHEMIDEMYEGYSGYSEGKNRYGETYSGPETMEPLEAMLESVVDFMEMLKRDASSQEEVDMIKHYSRMIAEM